jgi:hypothetical protein
MILRRVANLALLFFIISSCTTNENSNENDVFRKYYDKDEGLIEYEAFYHKNELKELRGFSKDGDLVDSLYRVNDSIRYEILDENLHVEDTVTINIKFNSPLFKDQYVMLTDSIKVEELLYQNDYIYANYNGEVEIKFILVEPGKNTVTGVLFNTSVEVLEYINQNEFVGRRVGMFKEFNVEFDVAPREE